MHAYSIGLIIEGKRGPFGLSVRDVGALLT